MSSHPMPAYRLQSDGLDVEILAVGASVRSIAMAGVAVPLILGALDRDVYGPRNRSFLGATVGRHANRIAGARFALAGEEHRLSVNEPPHHLHGGATGLWAKTWTLLDRGERHLVLGVVSPDGDDGYPGRANVEAHFSLEEAGALSIAYRGTCDRPSPLNIAPHFYFNLSGRPSARDHVLTIAADAYLPVDETLIPTGEIRDVAGSRFDFRGGRRIDEGPALLDHCFCLAGGRTLEPRPVLTLSCDTSEISIGLETTEAGVQVYDGSSFDGSFRGLDGTAIGPYGGIAIEPQGWPDAPNRPNFPSPIVHPGEAYIHRSRFRFTRP
ncbi:MAG: galactose mutarotase [Rhizobiaceae bacterium]|nr:galactose mutarotase [Rhizobiaceae bacterium]